MESQIPILDPNAIVNITHYILNLSRGHVFGRFKDKRFEANNSFAVVEL